jgi:molybdopterin-guanine dinucleotide biosynthesis protein A
MTTSVGVFSFGRKQSQRCPNKMLRPFAGTTLADIVLDKLSAFAPNSFFAACEDEFEEKCRRHGVPYVARDPHSASIDEPITEILSFLRAIPYTHLLIVNGCLPFLRTATIAGFLEDCQRGALAPAFAVTRRRNHFMSLDRRPLNFPIDMKTINTKTVEPVLEFAHALYFFDKAYFFEHGKYWDWHTVRLVEAVAPHELVDIDTEEDFTFAEAIWKGMTPSPASSV